MFLLAMVIISKIGGVDYMAENKLITGEKDMKLIKEMNEPSSVG